MRHPATSVTDMGEQTFQRLRYAIEIQRLHQERRIAKLSQRLHIQPAPKLRFTALLLPGGGDAGQVGRMHRVTRPPLLQFVKRSAKILEHLAVHVFDLALGVMTAIRPGTTERRSRGLAKPRE